MNPEQLMYRALIEAQKALEKKEVPIGAVIFCQQENKIIGTGYNQKEETNNPTTHAEILAIQEACIHRKNWRLEKTILVSTVEPCVMCAGAIIQARIPEVIFGIRDEKFGALGSIVDLRKEKWNHNFTIIEGILKKECRDILQNFFEELRTQPKNEA